ncbi:MAG: branched-chain amino acid ABC transporter permease [Saccharofermentanales bacterium]|jgi:branched-chain amino acid transport system permease protein
MTEFLQQITNGVIVGATYALLTIGLTMIFGLMDILNYAHGELYMMGGVAAYFIMELGGISYFMSIPLTILLCFFIGLVIELVLARNLYSAPLVTTAIATVGLSIFLQNTIFLFWGNMPRTLRSPFPIKPLYVGNVTLPPVRLFVLIIAVAVIVATQIVIKYTKIGRAMRATFQDREAAQLSGINTKMIYAVTFAYGSALAGLSGLLSGSFLTVSPFMGPAVTNKAWAIAIMGGKGNILGAIFGGFILGVVENLGAGYISSAYKDVFSFVIVVLVLVFKPEGLFTRKSQNIGSKRGKLTAKETK